MVTKEEKGKEKKMKGKVRFLLRQPDEERRGVGLLFLSFPGSWPTSKQKEKTYKGEKKGEGGKESARLSFRKRKRG